ncbi:hypothetical protein T05_12044 [Trichinella murrelli]|uniref:Uncharacterized protein n=1 Tax=Trichinella murrelli TaxID=144512 RepID=A0A0V0U1R1_9BILA|nr:hypothetical protein T05_12044 [Trichinella murrelli]
MNHHIIYGKCMKMIIFLKFFKTAYNIYGINLMLMYNADGKLKKKQEESQEHKKAVRSSSSSSIESFTKKNE